MYITNGLFILNVYYSEISDFIESVNLVSKTPWGRHILCNGRIAVLYKDKPKCFLYIFVFVHIIAYRLLISDTQDGPQTILGEVDPNLNSYVIDGLLPDRTYFVHIRVVAGFGTSEVAFSDPVTTQVNTGKHV